VRRGARSQRCYVDLLALSKRRGAERANQRAVPDAREPAGIPLTVTCPREQTPPSPQDRSFQPWTKSAQNGATLANGYRSYCSGTLKDSWYESALAVCAAAKSFIPGQSKN